MKDNNHENNIFKQISNILINKDALLIVTKYGVFGIVWILLSDYILQSLISDFETYKLIQIYKGWFFIFITIVVVYILIYRREKKIRKATDESYKAIKELKHMAFYDALTGLPNRVLFNDKMKNLASNSNEEFAIALLDIDNFKYINDTVGHYVGDDFLKYISNKLSNEIKAPNIVARLGGDEFAILFKEFESEETLLNKLEAIKVCIGNIWLTEGREFFISVSIGVSTYPHDGCDHETLLKNSDIAMNAAKKDGKNKILFYEEYIHEETLWHIKIANKLQKGLDNQEFELYYQPQIELSSGKIKGMEALIRWNHLQEFMSPAEFIPVAEITGHIYELERRIIRNVLIQKKKWIDQGLENVDISVNLSSKSLISSSNFKKIEEIFSEFDMDYSNIVIEITETAALSNIDIAIERLNILKSKSLKIALDDFGTGYSSITHLMMLPIDIIKLDKSYINSKYGGTKDIQVVKFIVSLAHDLGLRVVAEGIETIEQMDYLKSINCEYGQGYFIGRPMSLCQINELLQNGKYMKKHQID